ncbi:MAG: ABC transporter permease, partial [Bacteroidetes bacterium]|nr:ABC transporter permease [Bacteroidota bacterium]
MNTNLKLAWRNLWRNRRRTIIAISSIVFSVLLASWMRSMQGGSYDSMIDNSA